MYNMSTAVAPLSVESAPGIIIAHGEVTDIENTAIIYPFIVCIADLFILFQAMWARPGVIAKCRECSYQVMVAIVGRFVSMSLFLICQSVITLNRTLACLKGRISMA